MKQSFGNLTDKTFLDKWNVEFEKFGGINLIAKPKLKEYVLVDPYVLIWCGEIMNIYFFIRKKYRKVWYKI